MRGWRKSAGAECVEAFLVTLLPSVSLDMKVRLWIQWRSKRFPTGSNAIVCQTKDAVS